jgi:hypothetical protein
MAKPTLIGAEASVSQARPCEHSCERNPDLPPLFVTFTELVQSVGTRQVDQQTLLGLGAISQYAVWSDGIVLHSPHLDQ